MDVCVVIFFVLICSLSGHWVVAFVFLFPCNLMGSICTLVAMRRINDLTKALEAKGIFASQTLMSTYTACFLAYAISTTTASLFMMFRWHNQDTVRDFWL